MPRRARIHKRVGEAIEAMQGRRRGRYLPELAYHFTRAADAEDAEKAITYALRAAEQATTMLAHEEAAGHYARALDVQRRFQPEAITAPPASCCWPSARPGCGAASAPRAHPPSARPPRWPSSSGTAPPWPEPRSAPRGATCSRRGWSTAS